MSLGTDTAVALTDDGSLWGWGKNDDGCAGTLVVDGNAWLGAPTPGSSLRPDLRFVAASMGNDHAALVDGDGNGWVIGAVVNAVRGDGRTGHRDESVLPPWATRTTAPFDGVP